MTETYNPEPSALTRKRIRLQEKEAAREARREKLGTWLESSRGQVTLIAGLLVVLAIGARMAFLLGN